MPWDPRPHLHGVSYPPVPPTSPGSPSHGRSREEAYWRVSNTSSPLEKVSPFQLKPRETRFSPGLGREGPWVRQPLLWGPSAFILLKDQCPKSHTERQSPPRASHLHPCCEGVSRRHLSKYVRTPLRVHQKMSTCYLQSKEATRVCKDIPAWPRIVQQQSIVVGFKQEQTRT